MINSDTKFCISISSNPSAFGTTVHNAAYKSLGINYIYKAFSVVDVENVIKGIRAIGIHGCSVSMPFKTKVMPFLDEIDSNAKEIGAINTILNKNGHLVGYNTDYIGALKSLDSLKVDFKKKVLILGAGGVSRAILLALKHLGFQNISVANRNDKKKEALNDIVKINNIDWKDRNQLFPDLIINATPHGMKNEKYHTLVNTETLLYSSAIMDVVVSKKDTSLIENSKKMKKKTVDGKFMTFEQALEQFFIYTGVIAPKKVMKESMNNLFK